MKLKQPSQPNAYAVRIVRDIRSAAGQRFSAEDKIRIMPDGVRGEVSCLLPSVTLYA